MSKVLIINGSPRLNGNTAIAVREKYFMRMVLKLQQFRLVTKI